MPLHRLSVCAVAYRGGNDPSPLYEHECKAEGYTKMYFFKRILYQFLFHSSQHQKDYIVERCRGPQPGPQIQLTVVIAEYHTENYYKFECVSIINNFNNLYPLLISMLKSRIMCDACSVCGRVQIHV